MDEELRQDIISFHRQHRWERWTIADTYWEFRRTDKTLTYEQVRAIINADKAQRGEKISHETRDTQRSRLYRWEQSLRAEVTNGQRYVPMSLGECEKLIAEAYDLYGLEWQGKVLPGLDKGRYARGNAATVTLPKSWARTPSVVLHEASHGILFTLKAKAKAWGKWAAHGPEFATIMVSTWDALGVIDAGLALESAKTLRIRFSEEPQFKVLPRFTLDELAADDGRPLS